MSCKSCQAAIAQFNYLEVDSGDNLHFVADLVIVVGDIEMGGTWAFCAWEKCFLASLMKVSNF